MPKKPSCSDYIIAAIRQTRSERKNLKAGASTGKQLHVIYSLAKEFYSERVFRQSLHALIESNTVLVVAKVVDVLKRVGVEEWRRSETQKLSRLPPNTPLGKACWYFDAKGRSIEFQAGGEYARRILCIALYVVADGLPDSVKRIISGFGRTKAEQIMASLQSK